MAKFSVLDYFLVILMAVIPFVVGFFSIIFIQLFSSPMDYFNSIFSKAIVVLGMTISFTIILVLPFDKWALLGGGLSVATPYIWQILFACIAFYVILVIPFAFWYYESHNTDKSGMKGLLSQICHGVVASLVCFVIAALAIIISYIWLGYAELSVEVHNQAAFGDTFYDVNRNITAGVGLNTVLKKSLLNVRMSFVVYITAMLSIAGWLIFIVFGGCGMTALPLELIFCFLKKPKPLSQRDFQIAQRLFASRAEKLIKVGQLINDSRKTLKGRTTRKNVSKYQKFKKAVYQCEEEYKKVEIAYKQGGGNPFVYIFAFVLGIVSAILTVLWIVHMIIYMVPRPPIWPMLNQFFEWFDMGFPLFGLIAYLIFTYYLLFAVLAGNVRIMSRIPLVAVFPLKYRDTATSSFLYNTGLMLLSSITIVQFSANAFADYIKYTSIDLFFNVFVANMIYIKYFYIYVHYVLFGFIFIGFVLTVLSLIPGPCNNYHKAPEEKELDEILRSLEYEARR